MTWANADDRVKRYRDAYLTMARDARYRPQAPGDGCGHASLTKEQARDRDRLETEARRYAIEFTKDDDRMEHWTGCTNWDTSKASVFIIEAAKALCGAHDLLALDLLNMAVREIKANGRLARDPWSAYPTHNRKRRDQ